MKIMNIVFSQPAWEQYTNWTQQDKKTVKKINDLIQDILRQGPGVGIGKPEALRHFSVWSRRINLEDRLVYQIDSNQNLLIIACKGHYED